MEDSISIAELVQSLSPKLFLEVTNKQTGRQSIINTAKIEAVCALTDGGTRINYSSRNERGQVLDCREAYSEVRYALGFREPELEKLEDLGVEPKEKGE